MLPVAIVEAQLIAANSRIRASEIGYGADSASQFVLLQLPRSSAQARSLISRAISLADLVFAARITGVTKPFSNATATLTSTCEKPESHPAQQRWRRGRLLTQRPSLDQQSFSEALPASVNPARLLHH